MKNKLLILIFCLTGTILNAQISSNTCVLAGSETHITAAGTFSVTGFDGTAPTEICTSNSAANNAEWFAYTPTNNYNVTISSDLASNDISDTRLHIYSDCGTLDCVGGNDDGGTIYSRFSVASFNALANQTYYIAWDNKFGSKDFDFTLSEDVLGEVSFTQQTISTNGTFRAVVDMNNDFRDDIVSVVARTVIPDEPDVPYTVYDLNIQHQLAGGGFTGTDYVVSAPYSASWSLAAGDYNADGYTDLVMGNGSGVNVIKAENNGTSYSVAASNSGVFTQRTNFVDINGDGHLDVFVCHDVAPNVYYINDGNNNLTYYQGEDVNGVPEGLGVYSSGGNYGSVWIDYDNDRDMDMFMAKCGGVTERRMNQLFRNNGNGSFTEVSIESGLADPMQTWSSAWGDYDNDGDMDCFIGGYNGTAHKMMRNNNNGTFTDITPSTGIAAFTHSGIDNAPGDFNNDGFVDILSNGKILLNNGNMTFTALTENMPEHGGIGDLNNDGFLDVFGSAIYYNNATNGNNWIKIQTSGDSSNKGGIGARVEINSPGIGKQIRDVRSGEGFRYMSSLTTHFGLGADTSVSSVTIYWPSGAVDVINNPSLNQKITINEGAPLGLETVIAEDLILHPNPTKKFLNINTKYNLENLVYSIFDLSGKRIMNSKFTSKTIDVSTLSTGTYFLRIMDNNLTQTQKFIKE